MRLEGRGKGVVVMAAVKKVLFGKREKKDFLATVQHRVDEYFQETGLSKQANVQMVWKSIFLWSLYFILVGCIFSNLFQGIPLILFFMVLGTTKGLIGFNMVHDALHGAYTTSPWLNALMGYSFDLNGTSSYIWKITHNGLHHIYTNIAGKDDDINKASILRFSPHDPLLFFHRFQHIYAFFLYGVTTLNWTLYSDYAWFYVNWKENKAPWKDVVLFLGFKLLNLSLFLFLPMFLLSAPWWQIVLGFVAMHVGGGLPISVVFQLAHMVEGVDFPLPDSEGKIEKPWAEHELETTSNFARQNAWMSYFMGGLNFQVEHHLFPQICHIHYSKIAPIVKRTAKEFGLPYNEIPTFSKALGSHIRTLRNFGRGLPPNVCKTSKRPMASQTCTSS